MFYNILLFVAVLVLDHDTVTLVYLMVRNYLQIVDQYYLEVELALLALLVKYRCLNHTISNLVNSYIYTHYGHKLLLFYLQRVA